jgi:hypothetical protein
VAATLALALVSAAMLLTGADCVVEDHVVSTATVVAGRLRF